MHALPVLMWASCLTAALRADSKTTMPSPPPSSREIELEHENVSDSSILTERIVGGCEAAPGQFPYQAALYIDVTGVSGLRFCGGAVLSSQLVVTAAHCTPLNTTRNIYVFVGGHYRQKSEPSRKRITADSFYPHENFTEADLTNDISLVHLPAPLEFNERIQPIRLPAADIGPLSGEKVVMSGWGRTWTYSELSPVLRFVQSTVLSNDFCQLPYLLSAKIHASHLCVSGWFMKGTCMGDSGGPLTFAEKDGKPTLVGIVSFGIKFSCNISWPPVFSRVSSFLSWITTAREDLERGRKAKTAKWLRRGSRRGVMWVITPSP